MYRACKKHNRFLGKTWLFFYLVIFWTISLPCLALSQEPALILHDQQRGTSVELYFGPETDEPAGYFLYVNKKFDYFGYIPSEITTVVLIPDNDDGLILTSVDEKATLRMSGGFAEFIPGGLQGSYEQALQGIEQQIDSSGYDEEKQFWELEWTADGIKHHRKFCINNDIMSECMFSYPQSEQEKYRDMAKIISSTFNHDDHD